MFEEYPKYAASRNAESIRPSSWVLEVVVAVNISGSHFRLPGIAFDSVWRTEAGTSPPVNISGQTTSAIASVEQACYRCQVFKS